MISKIYEHASKAALDLLSSTMSKTIKIIAAIIIKSEISITSLTLKILVFFLKARAHGLFRNEEIIGI